MLANFVNDREEEEMKAGSIGFIVLLLCMMQASLAQAVPPAVQAKSEYMLADKLYNSRDYAGAIAHAEKARSILGKSNSRIEYMLTRAYFRGKQYSQAMTAVEAFFALTPESESGSDAFSEMVELYSQIGVEKKKDDKVMGCKQTRKKVSDAIVDAREKWKSELVAIGEEKKQDNSACYESCDNKHSWSKQNRASCKRQCRVSRLTRLADRCRPIWKEMQRLTQMNEAWGKNQQFSIGESKTDDIYVLWVPFPCGGRTYRLPKEGGSYNILSDDPDWMLAVYQPAYCSE